MEENKYFRHIILYHFKKGKNSTEMQEKICAVCGEHAVADRTCLKWLVRFCAGDFSLDDAPQSGRPAEVDRDQIKTLIENNPCYTTQEVADILTICKSMMLLANLKNTSFILQKKTYELFLHPINAESKTLVIRMLNEL